MGKNLKLRKRKKPSSPNSYLKQDLPNKEEVWGGRLLSTLRSGEASSVFEIALFEVDAVFEVDVLAIKACQALALPKEKPTVRAYTT